MNHVNTIRNIEKDKDLFLAAARLERHESKIEPLKANDIVKICTAFAVALVLCAVLVFGYLSGHFIPALLGSGFLMFIGGAMAACR